MQGELTDVYGSSLSSYAQVKFLVVEFKRCQDAHWMPSTKKYITQFGILYTLIRIRMEEIAQAFLGTGLTISFMFEQRVGSQHLLAMICWQPEHQYTLPCWNVNGQNMIFAPSGDCRIIIRKVVQSRRWVGPVSPMPNTFKTQPPAKKIIVKEYGTQKVYCWNFIRVKYKI